MRKRSSEAAWLSKTGNHTSCNSIQAKFTIYVVWYIVLHLWECINMYVEILCKKATQLCFGQLTFPEFVNKANIKKVTVSEKPGGLLIMGA